MGDRQPSFSTQVHSKHKGRLTPFVEVKIQEYITVIKRECIRHTLSQAGTSKMRKSYKLLEEQKDDGTHYIDEWIIAVDAVDIHPDKIPALKNVQHIQQFRWYDRACIHDQSERRRLAAGEWQYSCCPDSPCRRPGGRVSANQKLQGTRCPLPVKTDIHQTSTMIST